MKSLTFVLLVLGFGLIGQCFVNSEPLNLNRIKRGFFNNNDLSSSDDRSCEQPDSCPECYLNLDHSLKEKLCNQQFGKKFMFCLAN